jgi:hypothetical protein
MRWMVEGWSRSSGRAVRDWLTFGSVEPGLAYLESPATEAVVHREVSGPDGERPEMEAER